MDHVDLRCPQCGSPVLATANYCVICGIRLPDTFDAEEEVIGGWEVAHQPNAPIAPIPTIEIPEFEESADGEPDADDLNPEPASIAYDAIPDIALSELDAYISDSDPNSDDNADNESDDSKDQEISEMIGEGSPVTMPEADDAWIKSPVEAASDHAPDVMVAEGAPDRLEDASDVTYTEAERDDDDVLEADEMTSEGGPAINDAIDSDDEELCDSSEPEPEPGMIDMIAEGAPIGLDVEVAPVAASQPVESAADPSEANEAIHSADDLSSALLMPDDADTPMISASYPETLSTATSGETGGHHWWPEDNDDDWVYFEPVGEVKTSIAAVAEPVAVSDPEALNRAVGLLDELRALLPSLGATSQPAPPPDFSELRTMAIAARGEPSFDDWAALRQVATSAAGRPTDIETILQLSKRVDDIAALIAERDRLHDAFKRVLAWIDAAEERS
jgi:hypothetical protein